MTRDEPTQAPPALQILLAIIAIVGGSVLLFDLISGWSVADQVDRWIYIVLVPLLIIPGVFLLLRAIRRQRGR